MSLYLGNNLISGVATPIEGARNIGQIIQSTIPLSDAGLHLLDGALISGSGSYADFVTYIAGLVSGYPDLFETEANWQTSVTNYGVCGKFVYDSVNNTVRLPKITGFIEGTTDVTALGDLIESGLPNITGSISNDVWPQPLQESGAFYRTNITVTARTSGTVSANAGFLQNFDASLTNSIYGNSTTVQPQAIKVLYYIVIATSTKTQIEVDIDEIATDLNGKVDIDLSNMNPTQTAKDTIVGWGMPDYSAGISKTSGSSAPTKGWAIAFGINASVAMYVNGVQVAQGDWQAGAWSGNWNMQIMVDKDDVVTGSSWTFFPCKGA